MRKARLVLPFLIAWIFSGPLAGRELKEFQITLPPLVLTEVEFRLEVVAVDEAGEPLPDYEAAVNVGGIQRSQGEEFRFQGGKLIVTDARVRESGRVQVTVSDGSVSSLAQTRAIPGVLSILPPLLAILLALTLRQVLVSLLAGIWLGAVFLFDYDLLGAFFRVLDHFVLKALGDPSHLQIIVFSMLFGGMVGVISENGGTRGIAELITRYARSDRGGQLATWFLALVLFFDDYANVLVRGNLMRPITDRLRVSREKLSFLVDTGAATVASIFIISTWIGYEVGLIEQGLRIIGSQEDAYSVFLRTIPYRFYPILALIFALQVSWLNRDFGPMLEAERRSRLTGQVLREGARPATDLTETTSREGGSPPARWVNGLLPIATILVVGLGGLYLTGSRALQQQGLETYGVGEIISNADSYLALLWASLAGCLMAMGLTLLQRILSLEQTFDAWFNGTKAMLLAMMILILAWSIGAVTEELHTADYLVQQLRGTLSPHFLPVLTFLIAALVSFATGTSWGTMAIMMPIVIPLAHNLGLEAGLSLSEAHTILLGVISSVLAGAVFGDHCSPISDTTILSSMASACDHIDHVKTQLPYAVLAALVGMLVGDIPTAFGLSPWISILAGTLLLGGVLLLFGKNPNHFQEREV